MGFKWGEVGKWIDLYGVRERVTKIKHNGDMNSSSNGAVVKTSTKEMPAAAPQLFTDILSDVACFIQMSDMFEVLPKLHEGPLNVNILGERKLVSCVTRITRKPGLKKRILKKGTRLLAPTWYLQRNLDEVTKKLRAAVEKGLAVGDNVLLGSLINTLLSYPDVPFNFEGVYHPDTHEEIVSPKYRLSSRLLYPKELQLMKYVRARLKAGRKVGVYAIYTGKLGTLQRLQTLFEERGIKTAVLESNVDGPEREEWIAKREAEGVQVLLTNPILVSTGLDLLNFPSLYFYQTGYRLTIIRQASRRHWRIGQRNVCETVYSGYQDTMQELAINLMAAKMSAALALEGQFSDEGLAALTEGAGGSLANELAKRFVGAKIEGVESAESIWGKMTIDAAQFIDVNSDSNVKTELSNEEDEDLIGDFIDRSISPASDKRRYYGSSLELALLDWVEDVVPADMYSRCLQQIDYLVDHINAGVLGLTVSKPSLLADYEVMWDPEVVSLEEEDFRRWVHMLTNKPLKDEVFSAPEWKLELLVEGVVPKVKSKKMYKVSEGQFAFNF
ncbi:MAG: hypothetical protein ACE3L7_01745 [Candidatus Pristimantibacillus sp.]